MNDKYILCSDLNTNHSILYHNEFTTILVAPFMFMIEEREHILTQFHGLDIKWEILHLHLSGTHEQIRAHMGTRAHAHASVCADRHTDIDLDDPLTHPHALQQTVYLRIACPSSTVDQEEMGQFKVLVRNCGIRST